MSCATLQKLEFWLGGRLAKYNFLETSFWSPSSFPCFSSLMKLLRRFV